MEALKPSPARAVVRLLAVGVLAASLLTSVGPVAAGNPPGNNGTIKVDGVEFDRHPNNEPHVDCIFEIDFYGFDQGDLYADVQFAVHPPTGRAVIVNDRVFIGEDDNAGGGSEAGWDASRRYDLSDELARYSAHPQQGYHVKLTVHADGSQGADTKHKVFWVGPCRQTGDSAPSGGGTPSQEVEGGRGTPSVTTGGGVGAGRGQGPTISVMPDTAVELRTGEAPLSVPFAAAVFALVAVAFTRLARRPAPGVSEG